MTKSLYLLIITALISLTVSQANAECPLARQSRLAGGFDRAAKESRACLKLNPGNVAAMLELSRALGLRGDHTDALLWVDRALARYPQDLDMRAWRVRLLAWRGDLEKAWEESETHLLPVEGYIEAQDPENARLKADLALWTARLPQAQARYGTILKTWPSDHRSRLGRARSNEAQDKLPQARTDYDILCKEGDSAACRWGHMDQRRDLHLRGRAIAHWLVLTEDRPDWSELDLGLETILDRRLHLDLETRLLRRDFGTGTISDIFLKGQSTWRDDAWFVSAAGGITPKADFYPDWTLSLEPGLILAPGIELALGVRRLDFSGKGAFVMSPSLSLDSQAWRINLRAYAGVDDEGKWNGSSFFRVGRNFLEDAHAYLGAGLGNGTDYLQLVRVGETGEFWLGLAGVSWQINWRHHIRLDYTLRAEEIGDRSLSLHQFSLGYVTSL